MGSESLMHTFYTSYNNVDDVTISEPYDKEIAVHVNTFGNKYLRLISIMKQSTQEYYNMKMVLGVKVL